MKTQEKWLLFLFGVAFWVLGTVWYEMRGARVFETTSLNFWINFISTPIITTTICVLILRWRRIPAQHWCSAALLIAVPGMFGEAILLSRFAEFMPRMRPESGGPYGSFLFATYAIFLTIAEVVTLRSSKESAKGQAAS